MFIQFLNQGAESVMTNGSALNLDRMLHLCLLSEAQDKKNDFLKNVENRVDFIYSIGP